MNMTPSGYQPLASGLLVPVGASAYEGASGGHRWQDIGDYGPDTAVASGIQTLRARSHHNVRNNPWATNAVATWVAAAIGNGLTPRWRVKEQELRQELQELWGDWVNEADFDEVQSFYGLQALVVRTVINSGEAFVIKKPRPLSEGLSVPLQLQIIEPDMLASDIPDEALPSGGYVKGGIRFSKGGKRKAYCFYRNHPAESSLIGDPVDTVWIKAEHVLHVYRVDRPGQTHGAPWVSSCLLRLNELDQYEDAELVRKKTAALFAAFIQEATADSTGGPTIGQPKRSKGGKRITGLNPGTLQYLQPGQEVKFSNPADVGTTYEPWLRYQLLSIAKGYGITYEMLTGDLRGVNYSSIRAGLLEFRRLCQQVQHHMIIHQFCRPVGRWFMDFAVASGAVVIPDYLQRRRYYNRVSWRTPRWEEVDPLKKHLADLGDVRAGFAPISDKQAERGYDMEELFDMISDANQLIDEYDLRLDSDPRYVNGSGAEQKSVMEAALNNE
ncbi:phage portal protein [Microbacteriaceae bacterium 4G12]